MGRLTEIVPVYCDRFPEWKAMEEGKLYINKEYGLANHLCACGCGEQTVMDFKPINGNGWNLIENTDGTISFTPSVGNWNGQKPYHAHYFITNNKIIWC
jgi:Family of unknown function (DUF6527)